MTGRPEELFPLFAGVETLTGIGPKAAAALEPLGITRPRDILLTLPQGGVDRRRRASVRDVTPPCVATIAVTVTAHRPSGRPSGPYRIDVTDDAAEWSIVFFRARGAWLEAQLPIGARRVVSGKLDLFEGRAQMVHPDYMLTEEQAEEIPAFEPVYPLTAGVTQRAMSKAAASALTRVPDLPEWCDPDLVAQHGWPTWGAALQQAHAPAGSSDLAPDAPARARLAYDELFAHQVTLALARQTQRRKRGRGTEGDGRLSDALIAGLPYRPTGAQTRAVQEIAADLAAPRRMMRLLQGDVGAGKTLVALLALLRIVEAGGQGVLMAPTEILARQHMESLAPMLRDLNVRIALLTGRDKGAPRREKLEDLAAGRIDILLGTHAVFQADVHFHDLRLAVIDEQHRFGVAQRLALGEKGQAVDVLVMTATPIPRSLALSQYGDMDVSILDEKPPGRKPVVTSAVQAARLDAVVDRLGRAVAEGKQAYWVCPLVEESERVALASAEERFKFLRARLGEGRVGLVHGQMPSDEKDRAMARFVAGDTGVLVATTVIEVGVNVPNASIMVIEGAESFGLAQLHQLRGRVGRGSAESHCILLYQPPLTESGRRRIDILRQSEDGFRISEEDLALRGAGDVLGTAQSGLPRFRVADLERQAGLMQIAQKDARALLLADPDLSGRRGQAVRRLLWFMEQDRALRLLSVG